MKAKEYFQKHFADLPLQIKRGQWFEICANCFNEFSREQKEAMKNVHNSNSKIVKIRESMKKWEALGDLILKKYETLQVGKQDPTNDDDVDIIDVRQTKKFFNIWLKDYDLPLFEAVTNVKAADVYTKKNNKTPSYLANMTIGDLKSLLSHRL